MYWNFISYTIFQKGFILKDLYDYIKDLRLLFRFGNSNIWRGMSFEFVDFDNENNSIFQKMYLNGEW